MVREQQEEKLYRETSVMLLSKCFSDEEDQIEEDEDDHERPNSVDEEWHVNEVKDIQGKIFKENQFH